jgi:hypothetical protein
MESGHILRCLPAHNPHYALFAAMGDGGVTQSMANESVE